MISRGLKSLIFALLSLAVASATGRPATTKNPCKIAANLRYPASERVLIYLRDHGCTKELRTHAWFVFASIIHHAKPGDPPAWDTWPGRENATAKTTPLSKRVLDIPLEIVVPAFLTNDADEALAKSLSALRGHSDGTEIRYNPRAYGYIIGKDLFNLYTLQASLHALAGAPSYRRDISPFPRSSIIVKAIWLTVPELGNATVKIWNPKNCSGACIHDVTVIQAKGRKCNLPDTSPVFSSCFYHVPDSDPGSELILVGLHVITKEISDWTWSTFWWHPRPNAGENAHERLSERYIPGYWRHYLMNTTLSMETPWERDPSIGSPDTKEDKCGQAADQSSAAKICFNPFLEVPDSSMKNAELSNCINCHKRATYPPQLIGSPRRGYLSSDNLCFADTIRLDYLWSLSPLKSQLRIDNESFQEFLQTVRTRLQATSK